MLTYASGALAIISFACVCIRLRHFPHLPTRFFLLAIWFRYTMAAFPDVTYPPVALGLSLNALGSVIVAAVGLLLIPPKVLLLKQFAPVYLLCLVILISGIVNQAPSDTINVLLKWCYFFAVAGSGFAAFRRYGSKSVLAALALAYILPLGSLVMSVVLGVSWVDKDGAVVFKGSYDSELSLSVITLTYLVVVSFAGRAIRRYRLFMMFIGCAALILANYRTAMLAGIPILTAYFVFGTVNRFSGAQKAVVFVGISAISIVGATVLANVFSERFADLATVAQNSSIILSDPSQFDEGDKDIFSGRVFIWSEYLYKYLNGTDLQLLLGYGPEAWKDYFDLYAHNTFVSYLFEFGPPGLFLLCVLFGFQLLQAMRVPRGQRWMTCAPHLAFFVLNLATMPLWQVEGFIFYSVICAQSWWERVDSLAQSNRVSTGSRVQATAHALRPPFRPASPDFTQLR